MLLRWSLGGFGIPRETGNRGKRREKALWFVMLRLERGVCSLKPCWIDAVIGAELSCLAREPEIMWTPTEDEKLGVGECWSRGVCVLGVSNVPQHTRKHTLNAFVSMQHKLKGQHRNKDAHRTLLQWQQKLNKCLASTARAFSAEFVLIKPSNILFPIIPRRRRMLTAIFISYFIIKHALLFNSTRIRSASWSLNVMMISDR